MAIVGNQIQQAYGFNAFVDVFPMPIVASRDPVSGPGAAADQALAGQVWINTTSSDAFIMVNPTASTWISTAGAGGVFTSLTVTPGKTSITANTNAGNDILIQTNGGANETIDIINNRGTQIPALEVASILGGVELLGGAADPAAVDIVASNAAGGITNTSGTGGFTTTTTGALVLQSTQNANTALQLVTSGGAAEQLTIQSSMGTTAAAVAIAAISGGVVINGLTNVDLADGSTTPSINIANIAPTVNRATVVNGGTLGAAVSDTVNIATGGANFAGSSKIVNVATGNLVLGTQTVNIATGNVTAAQTQAVNIATGTGISTVTIGNTGGTSNVKLKGGTATVASPTATATINSGIGAATFTGFTINSGGATQTFQINSSSALLTSGIIASVGYTGNEAALLSISHIETNGGNFDVVVVNNGGANTNPAHAIIVSFMIVS